MATHREAVALSPEGEGTIHWTEAHDALSRLARRRAALDAEEGPWLLCASRLAVHEHLGCGSFVEYVERFFGYKPRTTQEKLRVAEALEELPRLRGALGSGVLGWCAIRELTRVAVPDTEEAWLEVARNKTLRQLEALVADRSPGDTPDAAGGRVPRRHVLRFEVAADTFAAFREAVRCLERTAGARMGHDALLLAMARQVLGGPGDDGRSSYQVSLHVCSQCRRGEQVACGELVAVEPAVVEMAECDAQHLGRLHPSMAVAPAMSERAANENAAPSGQSAQPPAGANDVAASTAGRCSSQVHVGATSEIQNEGQSDAPNYASSATVVTAPAAIAPAATAPAATAISSGAAPAPATRSAIPRARQSIPPALRRAVLERDRHRCQVPGCTHSTYVDVHHIQRRADGGLNVISNLLTLCSAHHRATHRGELHIERDPQGAIVFRHADGSPYGQPPSPERIDAHTKVFSALRNLGFRELEVKAVLAELRADPALGDATVQQLLREALCRIQPRAR